MAKFGIFSHPNATELTDRDEIWHIRIDYEFTLAYRILPSSVKGADYRSPPNVNICPKLQFFVQKGEAINGSK